MAHPQSSVGCDRRIRARIARQYNNSWIGRGWPYVADHDLWNTPRIVSVFSRYLDEPSTTHACAAWEHLGHTARNCAI